MQKEQATGEPSITEQVTEVKAKLAHNVRSNAKKHCTLTPIQVTTILAKHLPLDTQQSLLSEMADENPYRDIKTVTTPSGQQFLFSLAHISNEEALAKGHLEEVKHVIAKKVRRDSRISISLTPLCALYALRPEIKPINICSILNEMQTQARYGDLRTLTAASGELYLYCDMHITEKYASLLARAAVNDACTTIADTVREESKIYPRPTKASLFTSQVFGIPSGTLQHCIARLLNRPEFPDIRKMVHPTSEAVYLYSDLHMNEEHACIMMNRLESFEHAT